MFLEKQERKDSKCEDMVRKPCMTYHLTPNLAFANLNKSCTWMKFTNAYPTLHPRREASVKLIQTTNIRTILKIHPQIEEIDPPRTNPLNKNHQIPIAHLVRYVFDHHCCTCVQALFNPRDIQLVSIVHLIPVVQLQRRRRRRAKGAPMNP